MNLVPFILIAVSVLLAVAVVTCAVVWGHLARVHRSTQEQDEYDGPGTA